MILQKKQAEEKLAEWSSKLQDKLNQKGLKVVLLMPDYEFDKNTNDEITHIFDAKHCVVYLSLRQAGSDGSLYTPVLGISEKVRRPQKQGVGHARDYYASRVTQEPSFDKALQNVMKRNAQIDNVSKGSSNQDLPDYVVSADLPNGNKLIHIGMLELSKAKVGKLAELLNS